MSSKDKTETPDIKKCTSHVQEFGISLHVHEPGLSQQSATDWDWVT